jgi:hypothetical protein
VGCTETTAERIRSATFAEFYYGYGAAPGVDLGLPRQFSQLRDGVFQQRFEHGLTIANVGAHPVHVRLDASYSDLYGRVLRAVVVAPHSAEVLHALPRDTAPAGLPSDPRHDDTLPAGPVPTRLPAVRTTPHARAGCCC